MDGLWRLPLLKPSALTKTLDGHFALIFRRGSHHWRTMERFENLVFEEEVSRAVCKFLAGKFVEVLEAADFPLFHQKMGKEDNSFPDKGRKGLA